MHKKPEKGETQRPYLTAQDSGHTALKLTTIGTQRKSYTK